MKTHQRIAVTALVFLTVSLGTRAAITTNYGNFEASTVWYEQVSEATDIGMYGAPKVAGDTLSFNPLGLEAASSGGGADTVNNAALDFDVQAKTGNYVAGFDFSEGGDFTMSGPGTDATRVEIAADFTISVFEVDGAAVPTITENFSMSFSPNADGIFELVTDGGGASFPPYSDNWSGSIYIDLGDMLDNNSVSYIDGATRANVSLVNILVAGSETDSSSQIKKKFENGISITSTVIPEPASLVLFAGAASIFTLIRRRFVG